MERTLLSLGSINADFQVRTHAAPGSTETLLAHDFCRFPGGKAANTAYLGALFGHRSYLFGRVGDDDLAEQALSPLREAGVEVTGVSRAEGQATGVSMIMVPPDGKKQIVLATNANDQWSEAAVDAMQRQIAGISGPACLVVDYEVPAWVVRRAVESARHCDVPVVIDPSFPDRVEDDLLGKLLAITPNLAEAEALLGKQLGSLDKVAEAARHFHSLGVRNVCIKLSDGGCVLVSEGQSMHLPAADVDPVDTTGAGDAFTGVLAISLLEGLDILEAASWAVAAANLAVTGYGSQPAYANRHDVKTMAEQRLQRAKRLDV